MAARPPLQASPPAYPLRVCALAADARAVEALVAALRDDPRLVCISEPAQADVLLWDAAEGAAPPAALLAPRVPWIALVAHAALAPAMLAHGANGVLQRHAPGTSLAAAVVAVRLGLCVLDLAAAESCLGEDAAAVGGEAEPMDALTAREREVLEALALGLSNRVIGERLGVSVHTVKFHVNAILAKLQVESRAGAVAKALRRGLLKA